MIAFVAPLAITIRIEVMRQKNIMTLRAGWMLVLIFSAIVTCESLKQQNSREPQEAFIQIVTEPGL